MDENESAEKRFKVTKKGCIGCGVIGVVLFIAAGVIGTCVDPDAFETTTAPAAAPDVHPDALRVIEALESARGLPPEHNAHEVAQELMGKTADRIGIDHEGVEEAFTTSLLVVTERALALRERRKNGRSANEGHGLRVYYDAAITAWRRVKP